MEKQIMKLAKNYAKKSSSKLFSDKIGKDVLVMSSKDIFGFSKLLGDALLSQPEEILELLEESFKKYNPSKKSPRIRLIELPKNTKLKIEDIRAKNLNKFVEVEGKIISISPIIMKVVCAKFECSKCKTEISVLQIKPPLKTPTKCKCGKKEHFRLASREIVDTQQLILKDTTSRNNSNLVRVLLQEDLTDMEKKRIVKDGNWIKVAGITKDLPFSDCDEGEPLSFNFMIEANNVSKLK